MSDADSLTRALTEVLVSRLGEVAGALRALNASLASGAARDADDAGVAEASRRADSHGWLLGLVGDRQGAGLLMTRHEPRGIALVLELVGEALARRGQVLELDGPLPELTPEGGAALCWTLAEALWSVAEREPRPDRVRARLVVGDEEARFEVRPDGPSVTLPRAGVRARPN